MSLLTARSTTSPLFASMRTLVAGRRRVPRRVRGEVAEEADEGVSLEAERGIAGEVETVRGRVRLERDERLGRTRVGRLGNDGLAPAAAPAPVRIVQPNPGRVVGPAGRSRRATALV